MPYEKFVRMTITMFRGASGLEGDSTVRFIEALHSGKLQAKLEKIHPNSRQINGLLKDLDNVEPTMREKFRELSTMLRPKHGGNPKRIKPSEVLRAREEFDKLKARKIPNQEIYEKVAKRLGKSPKTIRRVCDPNEAARSGCNYLGTKSPKPSRDIFLTSRN